MFAGDPDFEEIVRLGRKYRDQANSEIVADGFLIGGG
jgi:hypothetical protein